MYSLYYIRIQQFDELFIKLSSLIQLSLSNTLNVISYPNEPLDSSLSSSLLNVLCISSSPLIGEPAQQQLDEIEFKKKMFSSSMLKKRLLNWWKEKAEENTMANSKPKREEEHSIERRKAYSSSSSLPSDNASLHNSFFKKDVSSLNVWSLSYNCVLCLTPLSSSPSLFKLTCCGMLVHSHCFQYVQLKGSSFPSPIVCLHCSSQLVPNRKRKQIK